MCEYLTIAAAMADGVLDVNHMNVKPGGKQQIMRDSYRVPGESAIHFGKR